MGPLARLIAAIFPRPSGLEVDEPDPLRFGPPAVPGDLLRALPLLVDPPDAVLYWEGTSNRVLAEWLRRAAGDPPPEVVLGVSPVRDFHRLTPTPELVGELAERIEHGRLPRRVRLQLSEHGRLVLEWRRAFHRGPVVVSRRLAPDRIVAFLDATHLTQLPS